MHTPTSHTTTNTKLEPMVVRDRLSKDIGRILGESLHHFEEIEREAERNLFDVDGIISGRPSKEHRVSMRRSMHQTAARSFVPKRIPENAYTLTRPQKGNFIPSSYLSARSFQVA